ncbi:hypothetical protein HWV62_39043 [Athelia sp. TMB]|nr:hypothetical protein HWV62_39043 [Athelia sp. TMB]
MDISQMQMSNHQTDIYGQEKDQHLDSENAYPMDSDLDSLFAAQDSTMHMTGDSSSSPQSSPNDWSTMPTPSFWPTEPQTQMKDFGDLNTMGMDMEMLNPGMALDLLSQIDMAFNPNMAIDPNALHFNYSQSQDFGIFANDIGTGAGEPFPFTFNSHPSPSVTSASSGDDSHSKDRRLSVGSSSSAASPSPFMEHAQAAIPSAVSNAADELAERVRRSAGVMLAVPNGTSASSVHATQTQQPLSHSPALPHLAPVKPKVEPQLVPSPYNSTAPNTAPSSATSSPSPAPEEVKPTTGRTKTSHTTIERRYRTNLNARIQSLRNAVPALRVLEDKPKKTAKNLASPSAYPPNEEKNTDFVDVVDERGFIDGVKVARKCSKANVLGKAVEYIRVLKKREARLTREQDGLKALVKGLVGGSALLREWEEEWRATFGGKERDEVEGEEAEPMEDDENDDEGDGDDDDDERRRKKPKVAKAAPKASTAVKKAPAPVQTEAGGVVPEKRKRGRPRKVLAAPATQMSYAPVAPYPGPSSEAPATTSEQQAQPQQYLLATFALFTFFNSPLTSSTSPSASAHTHSGSVLGATPAYVQEGYGWRELVHVFHLAVSALVFFSIIVPWLPTALKRTRLLSLFSLSHNSSSSSPAKTTPVNSTVHLDALVHTRRGAPDETEALHSALGAPRGVLGLITGFHRPSTSTSFERRGLEQRAWVRLGELAALRPGRTSPAARLQVYLAMRAHVSWFKASTADLATMALVVRPLSTSKAEMLWGRAGKTEFVRPFERLVVGSLTVGEAAEKIARVQGGDEKLGPVALLAGVLIKERLRSELAALFVKTVLPSQESWTPVPSDCSKENERRAETINAGKSFGGRTRELAEAVEKVWASSSTKAVGDILTPPGSSSDELEVEICALLDALILYRYIFPTTLVPSGMGSVAVTLSPPTASSRKDAHLHLALRRVLGNSVFDSRPTEDEDEAPDPVLEDARDRVVDMLVEHERAGRVRAHRLK